ncbi:MAG: hypothetical protein WKG07_05770 [Hymenobacter sp.]
MGDSDSSSFCAGPRPLSSARATSPGFHPHPGLQRKRSPGPNADARADLPQRPALPQRSAGSRRRLDGRNPAGGRNRLRGPHQAGGGPRPQLPA